MSKGKRMMRWLEVILAGVLVLMLGACGSSGNAGTPGQGGPAKLSFKQALSFQDLKELDGSTVTINGYLATSSPVDGSFIFLMNMPFQSCPFCVPNTSQLSNTMEVYPKEGETFTYTNQAVKVVGKLVVAESEDQPFSDMYGYEFAFKLVDASYTILKGEDISEEMALWQKMAGSDVITEINAMYNYVNFLCAWNTYYVNNYDDGQGNIVPGYYLWPGDAQAYLEEGQYNYGYQEGYFDGIIADIKAVDPNAFEELVKNVEQAKQLAEEALQELMGEKYTYTEEYIEMFGGIDKVYTLDRGEELQSRMDELYYGFSSWLSVWEM